MAAARAGVGWGASRWIIGLACACFIGAPPPCQPRPANPGSAAPHTLSADRAQDFLVVEGPARISLEDDLAPIDRVEAVGHAGGRHEVGLRDEERDPHRL